MNVYKFLQETPIYDGIEYVIEEQNANAPRNFYIQGPYLMANVENLNKRVYNLNEMVCEVARYKKEFIDTNRAIGEICHPENSIDVDLTRACHMIVKMEQKENVFYGKSKVLNTPSGLIVKTLMQDGVKIGLSSRALGSLKQQGSVNMVEGFKLICLDVVHTPSINKTVDSIMENRQFIIAEGGRILELACDSLTCRMNSLPKKDVDTYISESFKTFFAELKK